MDTSTVSYLRRTALLEPHVLDGLEVFAAQPDRMPDGDIAGLVAIAASAARQAPNGGQSIQVACIERDLPRIANSTTRPAEASR